MSFPPLVYGARKIFSSIFSCAFPDALPLPFLDCEYEMDSAFFNAFSDTYSDSASARPARTREVISNHSFDVFFDIFCRAAPGIRSGFLMPFLLPFLIRNPPTCTGE